MAIDPSTITYPFDPSGALVSNLISGEQHVLTGSNYRDFYFIVPEYAPFFMDGMVISYLPPTGPSRILVYGIDYYGTHQFISGARACAKPIFGSITFTDLEMTGTVTISYQTLGGAWTVGTTTIAEILADRLHNPRNTSWDVVTEYPATFPVIDHEWDLVDMVGASDIVTALGGIEAAILLRVAQVAAAPETYTKVEMDALLAPLQAHVLDLDNPHETTNAQLVP